MATYTSGTTSTTWAAYVETGNSITTPFNAGGFGGNTSPNGTTYYRVYEASFFVKAYSSTGDIRFYCGTSPGSNNIEDVDFGSTNTSYTTESGATNFAITAGTTYYAGSYSSAGHYATRTNGGAPSGFAGVYTGSTLSTVSNASTSQVNFVLTYHGVPDQVTGVSASHVSGTTVTLSWSQPLGGGAAIRGYYIDHSTNGSSWTNIYDAESTTTSFTHNSAVQGATNYYRVSAFNNVRASTGTGVSGALGPYSTSATVSVPAATPPPVISGTYASGTVGVSYSSTISATNSPTLWTITGSLPPGLSHPNSSVSTISGTPTTAGTYNFTVKAENGGGYDQVSKSITINPPPNPAWSSTAAFPSGKVNQSYYASRSATNTTSITNANTNAPGLVAGAAATNVLGLTGTPTVAGTYTVSATANGATGTTPANLSTTVYIAPLVPPTWSDTSLSSVFKVGVSYATSSGGDNSVTATDATAFSVVSGALPAGISGTRSGTTYTLSGTPTTRGAYSFTLRASNTDGNATPDQTYSGSVTHPPFFTDETLAAVEQGRAYSDALVVSTSTAITWSITSGTLPTGLTAVASGTNTNTYTISGTPTGTGAYSFTVRATNGDGYIEKTFSGNVLEVPNWVDDELGSFVETVIYQDFVEATNSPTYAVQSGSLPTGISLNTSTGEVSGTPTVLNESYSFTIRATNADGYIEQTFTGTVQPDLGGGVKVYDGTTWNNEIVYAYDGAAWVEGKVYRYNGSIWVKSLF